MKVEHRGGGLHDSEHVGQEAHIAELTCRLKGKHEVIRATSESDNMYASVDQLTATLSRKLRKFKERRNDVKIQRKAGGKQEMNDELLGIDDFDFDDDADAAAAPSLPPLVVTPRASTPAPANGKVVKRKSFPMPPTSVDDAVLCLEMLDHPFYIFRNEDSGNINVVYSRNSGGVGLIEPDFE